MAIFKLRPLLTLRHYCQSSLSSWRWIRLFQRSRRLPEITQTLLILRISYQQSNFHSNQLLFDEFLFSMSKFSKWVRVRTTRLFHPTTTSFLLEHCVTLSVQPLCKCWNLLKAYRFSTWDYAWFYEMKIAYLGNSRPPPYQRGGEGGCNHLQMVIAPCSHCQWAPNCLLPLLLTNLENSALKLGDGQKLEFTTRHEPKE